MIVFAKVRDSYSFSFITGLNIIAPGNSNNRAVIGALCALTIIACLGYWIWAFKPFDKGDEVIGVQFVLKGGTVLIGRERFGGEISAWVSGEKGYFDDDGKGNFFRIENKSAKSAAPDGAWDVSWEWDELYLDGEKEPLISFVPTPEQRKETIDDLSASCTNSEDISCHWNITDKIEVESYLNGYICVADTSNEFYGGAHPLSLRRYGAYDLKRKQFLRLDDLIPSKDEQNIIWKALIENIQSFDRASLSLDQEMGIDTTNADEEPSGYFKGSGGGAPVERLGTILSGKGYTFNPNVFCPLIRPDGPVLIFGFPHAEQVNRGLNLKAEAPIDLKRANPKLRQLFKEYRFSEMAEAVLPYVTSIDGLWRISRTLDIVTVRYRDRLLEVNVPEDLEGSGEILGMFWIVKSPLKEELTRHKFKAAELKQDGEILKLQLSDYLH